MSRNYPFSAIVGQEDMKLAILVAALDPSVGGVLVMGDRGTGKSTAVRGLAALLPLAGINAVHEERLFTELGRRIRDVRQGPDGHLWLVDETEGRILRLDPA